MAVRGYPDGRSRRTLLELGGRGDIVPALELEIEASEIVVGLFFNLRRFCVEVADGYSPITPRIALDWSEFSGDFISGEEFGIITAMDAAYRKGMASVTAYFEARNK